MKSGFRWLLPELAVFCALAVASALAGDRPSNRGKAIEAEAATDHLTTWNSVHRFYKHFLICDDGGIREGVSDKVAKLLANRWDRFGECAKLASKDKAFEMFVVRHVDETIDWIHDAPKINENARLHCPSNAAQLCKALVEQTTPESR